MTTPTKPSEAAMKAAKKIRERNGVSYYLGDCDNLPDTDAYEVVAAIIDAELKPQREAMEALKAAVQDIALTYIPDSDSEKDYTPQDVVDKLNFCKRRAQEALATTPHDK